MATENNKTFMNAALLAAIVAANDHTLKMVQGARFNRAMPRLRASSSGNETTNTPHIGLRQQLRGLRPIYKAHNAPESTPCKCEQCKLYVTLSAQYEELKKG